METLFLLPQKAKELHVTKSLPRLARWICRQLTCNMFASLMVILNEVLSGQRSDYPFKEEDKPSENYRPWCSVFSSTAD